MASKIFLFLVLYLVKVQSYNTFKDNAQIPYRSVFDLGLYEEVLDEDQCREQLRFLSNHSLGLQFLDASAKIPSGILTGNLNDLGDYFQCLSINQFIDDMEIQGKYCAIIAPLDQNPIQLPEFPEWPDLPWPEIPWPQPDNETIEELQQFNRLQNWALGVAGFGEPIESRVFPMVITSTLGSTLGICIPKVCTTEQVLSFLNTEYSFLNVTYNEYFCRLPNDKLFSPADYVATVLFSFLGILICLSTFFDLHQLFVLKRESSQVNTLYRSFSVYTNTRRFLTFNAVPGSLECIDGIRAISMLWVVVGHTYSFTLLGYIHNLQETVEWISKFTSVWINAAPITVDTFFTLSGILVVYTTIGKINKDRFIRTVHLFYINRLLRMFPVLAAVVLLQASFFNHFSDGPFWVNVATTTENCRTYWWSILLHIQNYVNPTDICMPQTWYLSVDTQLYIVCPLVLVWLFGKERWSWCALSSILLLSLVSSSVYSFIYNFSAGLANPARLSEFGNYVRIYYINTLTRAPPFFVGMAYGYLLHLCRNRRIRISKLNVIVLWVMSLLIMSFCIFSHYFVMQVDHDVQIFDNFLNAYMRAIWACGLGWLIFACVHGYGGPVNWFLSLQMWKLPARLSFAMYLIHVPIIMIANGSWVKTHYFSEGDNIYRFMSDLTLTIAAAFILCIAIDAPFSTLQKLLLGGGAKKPQKPRSESKNNIVEDGQYIKTSL